MNPFQTSSKEKPVEDVKMNPYSDSKKQKNSSNDIDKQTNNGNEQKNNYNDKQKKNGNEPPKQKNSYYQPEDKPKNENGYYLYIAILFILLIICLVFGFAFSSGGNGSYPEIGNLAVLNSIITSIGSYPLPPPGYPMNITGTINNFNCSNNDTFKFNSTQGNKTTAGYYASCDIQINTVKGAFNFTMNNIDESSNVENNVQSTSGFFSATYNSDITITGMAKCKTTVYIPQTETCTKIYGPCCTDMFKSCFYDWSCYTKSCVTWPSTYNPDVLIPMNFPFTVTVSNGSITGKIDYKGTNRKSYIPSDRTTKYQIVPEYKGGRFYLFDSLLSELDMSYPSSGVKANVDTGGVPISFNTSAINSLVSTLTDELIKNVNGYLLSTLFSVN